MSKCCKCDTDLGLYVCERHKIYVCKSCLEGVKYEDGFNVEGLPVAKFIFKCEREDCNFQKVRR